MPDLKKVAQTLREMIQLADNGNLEERENSRYSHEWEILEEFEKDLGISPPEKTEQLWQVRCYVDQKAFDEVIAADITDGVTEEEAKREAQQDILTGGYEIVKIRTEDGEHSRIFRRKITVVEE